jgi:uncharacterized membrane protein YbhN (UPF0104 family)
LSPAACVGADYGFWRETRRRATLPDCAPAKIIFSAGMRPETRLPQAGRPWVRRSWLQYGVVGLLFVAVFVTMLRGWNELSGYQLLALGLWMLATLGGGLCWLMITRAFGLRLPPGPALRVYCTSNLGKYLPGKVLHVFARVYLVQQHGVSLAVGTTSTMLDALLYIAAGLVLSIFALPTVLGGSQPGMVAGAALAVPFGLVLLHPRVLNAVVAAAGRFIPRLRHVRVDLAYGTILGAFVLYLMLWLVVTATVYTGVRAVAVVSLDKAPILGAIFAFSYVTGLVTPMPAGVGGREAAMAWLFSSFMPFPAAVVATILNRLLQVGAEAVCAGFLSLVARR